MIASPHRLTLAALVASLAFAAPAAAQEGDLVKNLLSGAGILPKPNTDIDYRERAPLVVPPKLELRPPEAKGSLERSAAWPNDPDVARRRRDEADARRPAPAGDVNGNRVQRVDTNPRLDPRARVEAEAPHVTRGDNARDALVMSPDRLRSFTQAQKPEDVALTAGQDAPRRALTDPPGGYRRASETVRTSPEPIRDTEREEMDPTSFNRRQRAR